MMNGKSTISETLPLSRTNAQPVLAVTGVTGHIGGLVARGLSCENLPFRALARESSLIRIPELPGMAKEAFVYGDSPITRRALSGIDTLFMVSARESATRMDEHRGFVNAAKAAGLRQIVYASFDGASQDSAFTLGRDHYQTEEYIKESGISYTFLRDNFYLEALIDWASSGVIAGPAGDGKVSAVSQRDVAAAATAIMRNPRNHIGQTYTLTGPEALSLEDFARRYTSSTGTRVTYRNQTVEEAYASRRRDYDAPDWMLDAWVSTYTAIASGWLAHVSTDIRLLTGKDPLSLEDLVKREKQREEPERIEIGWLAAGA